MTRRVIGVVDYDVGNQASVVSTFRSLGYRCFSSKDRDLLAESDVLILPGVGAFPAAMASLRTLALDDFILERSSLGHPIIGLCLGMQLLAEQSTEHGITSGLGLIPGRVVPLHSPKYHIGWNTIQVSAQDPAFVPSDRHHFYFDHSFVFETENDFVVCSTTLEAEFTTGVRKRNVVGLQFHPEKSQASGRLLLKNLIEGFVDA